MINPDVWKNLPISHNFSISFESVGSRIVLITPYGLLTPPVLRLAIEIKYDFLDEINPNNNSYVEIFNLKNIKGLKGETKRAFFENIKNDRRNRNLLAVLGFNTTPAAYWISKALQFRVNFFGFDRLLETYSEAESYALNFLYEKETYSLREESLIKDKEYFLRISDYTEKFALLNSTIIYSKIEGTLNENIIRERFKIIENLLKNNFFPHNIHYGIVVWGKNAYLPMRLQRFYLTELFKFNKIYPCKQLCFIAENRDIEKLFSSSQNLFPVSMELSPDFSTSLKYINQLQAESTIGFGDAHDLLDDPYQSTYTQEQLDNYIREFTDFLSGATVYSEKELDGFIKALTPDHPFIPLYKVVNLLLYQYNEQYQLLNREKNNLILANNELLVKYLLYKTLQKTDSHGQSLSVLETLKKIPSISHASFFSVARDGEKIIMKCIVDLPKETRESLEGTVIPPVMAEFFIKDNFSARTPEQLISAAENSVSECGPHIHSFIKKRAFGFLITFYYIWDNKIPGCIYLEFEKDNSREYYDQMEKTFFEIYSVISVNPAETPSNSNKTNPMDYQIAVEEFDNSEDFLISVMKTFFDTVPKQIREIEEYIKIDNDEKIRKEAHKLKGGAANLFAEPLRLAAEELERAAKEKKREQYNTLCGDILKKIDELRKYLKNEKGLIL